MGVYNFIIFTFHYYLGRMIYGVSLGMMKWFLPFYLHVLMNCPFIQWWEWQYYCLLSSSVLMKMNSLHWQTGQTVAIKKIRLGDGKQKEGVNFTALREIKLLKELKDPNIIELIDAFPHKGNLHLVFEFMETDLEAVIRDRNIFLSPADIKSYLQMTLKGLAFCHKKWVLHR